MWRAVFAWMIVGRLRVLLAFVCCASSAAAQGPSRERDLAPPSRYDNARARIVGRIARPSRATLTHALTLGTSPDETARRLYGSNGPSVIDRLRQIGPGFEALAYHPGLVTRLDEFARFVAANGLREGAPEKARAAFSRHLGTKIVYRAEPLTHAELERTAVRGLESRLSQRDLDLSLVLHESTAVESDYGAHIAADTMSDSIRKQVAARVSGSTRVNDPLLSVTDHPEVGIAIVGRVVRQSRSQGGIEKQLHVFKLRLPVLDLISQESPIIDERTGRSFMKITRGDGSTVSHEFPSAAVESFVLFRVKPSEIVGHTIVEPDMTFTTAAKE